MRLVDLIAASALTVIVHKLRLLSYPNGAMNATASSDGSTREEALMLEIGLFHNGASSLPVIADKDGITFNKGSLGEVHQAAQETLVNQVRQ